MSRFVGNATACGSPDWRNPIQWVCAVLSLIWQLLQQLVDNHVIAYHLEPLLFSGLAPKTVKCYQKDVKEFVA